MTRRAMIALLVAANAVLATTLGILTLDLPEARAQAAPLASNYMVVAGVIQSNHDAIYVFDLSARTINVLDVDRTSRQLVLRDVRDLKQDFRAGN